MDFFFLPDLWFAGVICFEICVMLILLSYTSSVDIRVYIELKIIQQGLVIVVACFLLSFLKFPLECEKFQGSNKSALYTSEIAHQEFDMRKSNMFES